MTQYRVGAYSKVENQELDNAAKAADARVKRLMGPKWSANIYAARSLGSDALYVRIFLETEATKVTRHNSPILLDLMSHGADRNGKWALETIGGFRIPNGAKKYRKISAKGPHELLDKFISWLKVFVSSSPEVMKTV